jgi:CHAT domain-containing protein
MAAYVDHGLSLAERVRAETHLASCPQCTELLAGVARTVADRPGRTPGADDTGETPPLVTRRAVVGAAAAAAAVIAVLAAPSVVRPWLEPDAGLVSLVGSVGEQRSVLGRLTGGIPHAPLGSPPAGGQGGKAAGTDRVLMTAGKIRESFGDLQTPARLHAYGVNELLAGRYDEAAPALIAAAREQPDNARFLNDVATLHLERARLGMRPDDLPRAYAAADRARRLNPSLHEAWFNRALAATALALTDQARSAWRDYLERDAASPWASEARRRLEELSRPTPAQAWSALEGSLQRSIDADTADYAVRAQTTEARQYIENVLIVEWATAVLNGGSGDAELERVRTMAAAMQRIAGDSLYRDAVAAIDRAGASGADGLTRLARAHRQYAQAASLTAEDQHSAAVPLLLEARQALAAARSPFQWRAALDYGASAYFTGRARDAAPVLDEIIRTAQSAGYRFLEGRARWQQGLAAFLRGSLDEAQAHYEETLGVFERMSDVEQAAGAHNLLSALYFYLGDKAAEWRHRQAVLTALSASRSPRLRYAGLAAAAVSLRLESPETALALQDAALAVARAWGRDAAIAEVLAQRGATLQALGRSGDAMAAVGEARMHLQSIRTEDVRRFFEAPILAVESDLARASNPRRAAALAQRAIDILQARGERARLAQVQLRLAKANIVSGDLLAAEHALNEGIAAFDDQRARLADENALSAFDESWQLFETAARLAIRRGDYERAFALTERARARSLAEQRRAADLPTLVAVQRSLAANEAILALNQFDEELAIWTITHTGTTVSMRQLAREDARRLVARHQEEIRLEVSRPDAGGVLFDSIVRPAAAALGGATRVAFVPDATFADVSFAALWDKRRSRYLVENHTVTIAPTVSVVATVRQDAAGDTDRVLILGADEKVSAAVASSYAEPAVVTGAAATRNRFLQDAPTSAIVHIAVPATSSSAYPLLSRLVFSDEPGRRHSGAVLGHDIASRRMNAIRLVVLDEVRGEQVYRDAGHLGLARAFLAAGVPAVLGTLPGADEGVTRELMVRFHRQMAAQGSAADTLARIQRDELQRNGRRLGAWSALVIYGSER